MVWKGKGYCWRFLQYSWFLYVLFGRKIKTKQVNKGLRRMEHIFGLEGFTQEMDDCTGGCFGRCRGGCTEVHCGGACVRMGQ